MEKEEQSRKLNFLDVTIINTGAGTYKFKMQRKNAITNVQKNENKTNSYVNRALIRGILKGFVSRAKKLELNFFVDMFVENGHDRNHLYSVIRENKHQATKTENTDSNIVKSPMDTNYRTQNKKRTSKDRM